MKTGIEKIDIQELDNHTYELYHELKNGKLVSIAIGTKAVLIADLNKLIADLENI